MSEKKYKLGKKQSNGLHRVIALKDFGDVRKGDIGGYVESESNLSHEDNCWIYDAATVVGNAYVYGNAKVGGTSYVGDNARISGEATVTDRACVTLDATVTDRARVYGKAMISCDAYVSGSSQVYDEAQVTGNAAVYESARIQGESRVYDDARVAGGMYLCEAVRVGGNAILKGSEIIIEDIDICKSLYLQQPDVTIIGTDAGVLINSELYKWNFNSKNLKEIAKKHKLSASRMREIVPLLKMLHKQIGEMQNVG